MPRLFERRKILMNSKLIRSLLLLLCLSGSAFAQPAKLEKITVAGWNKPITEFTNLLVDEDKGFFRSQGLELAYVPGAGGGDAIRNILSGQADVAFTDPSSFFAALDKGEKLRAIYDIYPQNVFNVVSLKASGISQPSDLKGKRIGVYSLASGTRLNLQILLHHAGLTEADVTIVVTGLLNFAPLMQGQVDATAATDTGLLVGRQKGLGDLLKKFLAAYRDSAQWMIANPQEAAQLAVKRALDGQNPVINLEIIRLRNLSTVSATTQKNGLGAFDLATLQQAADAYKKLGIVQKDIRVREVVSQDLLP
jgi:NitT/TauT family transport system substrate-binding protein